MNTLPRFPFCMGLLLVAASAGPVAAQQPTQIVRDGTVGASAALQPVAANGVWEIGATLGVRAGRNLFHSFSLFNLGQGDTVLFTAKDAPTDNVISRVTGGPSSIDGTISSNIPSASLWFLNPAGVFFGQHASLNVQGSFHVSTADVLRMRDENGREFFAFSPDSLLRTATPIAFGFLSDHPAPITVQGSTLKLWDSGRLDLVGGDITIRGGQLVADGGAIAIASVASKGEAALTPRGLDTSAFSALGDLKIAEKSKLDAGSFLSDTAGDIAIRAGRFVLDSSKIAADRWSGSGGGMIDIGVRDDLQLLHGAAVQSSGWGDADSASIKVTSGSIEISGGSRIDASVQGGGKAGNITVDASRSIALTNAAPGANPFSTAIKSDNDSEGSSAGDITITSPSLALQAAAISATVFSPLANGPPGNIRIQTNDLTMSDGALIINAASEAGSSATREIRVTPLDPLQPSAIRLAGDGTEISSTSRGLNAGGAGNIALEASDISLAGGATISTAVWDSNLEAGKISIKTDRLSLDGGSTISSTADQSGAGGQITIDARDSVSIAGGSWLWTSTFGSGNAGNISIHAHNDGGTGTLSVDGAYIKSDNVSSAAVRAGQISVDADVVSVKNGGLVTSCAVTPGGAGSAGQVAVGAKRSLTVQGSGTEISSYTTGTGAAGNVFLSSPRIVISDQALVDSYTAVIPQNGSYTYASGQGGAVRIGRSPEVPIDTLDLVIQNGGQIAVSSINPGAGAAGSVEIDVARLKIESGGGILADTERGSDGAGGSINIQASESALLLGYSDDPHDLAFIAASTGGKGDAGSIVLHTPELTIEKGGIYATSGASGAAAGAAGSIFIGGNGNPVHQLTISDGAISAYAVQGPAPGQPREGNINIVSDQQVLLDQQSVISAQVEHGLGGDITISGPNQMVLRDSSRVMATTAVGTGGHIQIGSDVFVKTADSTVSADAGVGSSGIVEIRAPAIDLQGGLALPPPAFVSAAALLRPACAARSAKEKEGRFVVAQHRGLPPSPEDMLQAFDLPSAAPIPSSPLEPGGAEPVQIAQRSAAGGASSFRGGHFQQASERWAEAEALYARIGDRGARSDALRGLAQSQQALGQHAQSVQTLERALALAEEAKDQLRAASTLGSLGNARLALGQSAAAEKDLTRGVAIASNLGQDELQASLLNNLGNLHASQRDYDQAIAAYEQSAKFANRGGKALNEAKAWANAARTAIERGQANRGAALLERALATLEGLPEGYDKAQLRIHVAKSFERLAHLAPERRKQNLLAAYAALRAAVVSARQSGDARVLSYALGNLGALYHSEYREAEALYLVREALRAAEQIDAPELLYRWRWQEGQILWARGLAGPAIESYRRAVEILEETRQEALSRYGADETYFRQGMAPVYLDLVRALLDASKMSADAATSHQLLLEARDTVEHLKAAELRNYFRDECVADLQARTASPEAVAGRIAVVYPVLLPDRLELLVTLPAGLERYTVPVSSAVITTAAANFRRALGQPKSQDYLEPAQSLYRWLVGPYAERLSREQVETIVFVPDGPLRTIPMAALHDGKAFLVEQYGLVVTPGLALVDPRPMPRDKARLLVAGLSQAVQGQIALPSVESELAAVRKIYGAEPLLNEQFTSQHLERQLTEGRPSMVHIASHARFTGDSESSFILTYDSHVTMDDLSRMVGVAKFRDDPLELLVLSACETAAGDQRAALGLAGVALRAGARSVVGSLWPISDRATSELVARFYEALKDPTVSRGRALQRAQQALLHSPAYQHPFYWSPFLMIGNWL